MSKTGQKVLDEALQLELSATIGILIADQKIGGHREALEFCVPNDSFGSRCLPAEFSFQHCGEREDDFRPTTSEIMDLEELTIGGL
jgi:hypothetical protein